LQEYTGEIIVDHFIKQGKRSLDSDDDFEDEENEENEENEDNSNSRGVPVLDIKSPRKTFRPFDPLTRERERLTSLHYFFAPQALEWICVSVEAEKYVFFLNMT